MARAPVTIVIVREQESSTCDEWRGDARRSGSSASSHVPECRDHWLRELPLGLPTFSHEKESPTKKNLPRKKNFFVWGARAPRLSS